MVTAGRMSIIFPNFFPKLLNDNRSSVANLAAVVRTSHCIWEYVQDA